MRRLYRDDESLTPEGREFEDEIYRTIKPILRKAAESGVSVRDAGLIICGLISCLVSELVLEKQVSDRCVSRRTTTSEQFILTTLEGREVGITLPEIVALARSKGLSLSGDDIRSAALRMIDSKQLRLDEKMRLTQEKEYNNA